jgi:hypothetical protein
MYQGKYNEENQLDNTLKFPTIFGEIQGNA